MWEGDMMISWKSWDSDHLSTHVKLPFVKSHTFQFPQNPPCLSLASGTNGGGLKAPPTSIKLWGLGIGFWVILVYAQCHCAESPHNLKICNLLQLLQRTCQSEPNQLWSTIFGYPSLKITFQVSLYRPCSTQLELLWTSMSFHVAVQRMRVSSRSVQDFGSSLPTLSFVVLYEIHFRSNATKRASVGVICTALQLLLTSSAKYCKDTGYSAALLR